MTHSGDAIVIGNVSFLYLTPSNLETRTMTRGATGNTTTVAVVTGKGTNVSISRNGKPYQLLIDQLAIVMAATTISVGRKTKELLARKKRSIEEEEGGQLTWDQFFELVFTPPKPPKLTEEEAKELKKLVAEARPWKTRA